MIIKARQDHIPQLMHIWKTVFQDEDSFIRDFFREAFPYTEAYCREENGALTAMLYAIPCFVLDNNDSLKRGCYFYALATLKEYRGRGIMGNLIRYVLDEQKSDCDFFFLVPAQSSLLRYYEKFGFHSFPMESTFSGNNSQTVFFPHKLEQFFKNLSKEKPYHQPDLVAGMGDSSVLKPNGWIPK